MDSKVEINKKLIYINSASSGIAYVLNFIVLFWLQRYLLSKISPEEYSLYPIVMSIMMFFYMLRILIASGISRFTIEAYARGDEERLAQITSTMLLVELAGSLIIVIAGGLVCWKIDFLLKIAPQYVNDTRLMLGLLLLLFILQLLSSPFESGLDIKQKYLLTNFLNLGETLLRLGLLFFMLFAIGTKVLWVVVASFLAALANQFARILFSLHYVPALKFSPAKITWHKGRELLSFGSWNFILAIAYRIYTNSDTLILNRLATAWDVTLFHLGSLFQKELQRVIAPVTQPLFPVLTAMYAINDKQRIVNTYLRYGRYYTWLYFFIILPLVVYNQELIGLYVGKTYAVAGIIMLLLLTGLGVCVGNEMTYKLATAMGKIKGLAVRALIVQLCNLGLTIYFVGFHKLGALGSALASFISTAILSALIEFPYGLKLSGVTLKQYFKEIVIPGYTPGLCAFAVLYCLKLYAAPVSWLRLLVYSALGACCYLVMLAVCCLQPKDRQELSIFFQKLRSRKKEKKSAPDELL
jgi:O-antigen/teichoic acid export membrane protein